MKGERKLPPGILIGCGEAENPECVCEREREEVASRRSGWVEEEEEEAEKEEEGGGGGGGGREGQQSGGEEPEGRWMVQGQGESRGQAARSRANGGCKRLTPAERRATPR